MEEAKVDINARAETETWTDRGPWVTATDLALDLAENHGCPTAEAGFRGVFDYLRSRGGITT